MTTIHYFTETAGVDVSIASRLFLGEGLFETMRFERQNVWASARHWRRLTASAIALKIPFSLSLEEWNRALQYLIDDSHLSCGAIKAILIGGEASRALENDARTSSLLLRIFAYTPSLSPIRLIRAPWRRDARNPVYQHKTLQYLEAISARRHALAQGADDVVFEDMEGNITETGTANIFFISREKIYTPKDCGALLPGTYRARVLECAAKGAIPIIETQVSFQEALQAEALFTTNALQGIRAVKELEGHPKNTEHPLLRQLIASIKQFASFIK